MKKNLLRIFKPSLSGEKGQALVIVLVMLVIGSLTLVPVLDHAATVLKSGMTYEDKTDRYYAADAGIEEAMWQIKYDGLEALFGTNAYNYVFDTDASYTVDDQINAKTTNVTIENVWMPSNVTLDQLGLSASQAKSIIERPLSDNTTNRLVVTGAPLDADDFRIKIDFYPSVSTTDNLSVSSIGIWLPRGFEYAGSCNLAEFETTEDRYTESVATRPGGSAVVWDFSLDPLLFPDLPPEALEPTDFPQTAEITFKYTNGNPAARPNAVAWIVTAGSLSSDIPISWDVNTRYYKMTSESDGTSVEAYTSRTELASMYVSTPGDYKAVGNSLMTDDNHDGYYRETLQTSSTTALSGLPDDSYISKAWLYWSGFYDEGFNAEFWGDDGCSNWNNWVRNNETRHPTGDGDSSGTWTTSPYWDDVEETVFDDDDYITGTTTSGGSAYQLFTFSPFTVPAGVTIQDVTVVLRARDNSSGTNNIRPYIKVNGNRYSGTSINPTTTWTTYSYSWTENPATGSDWLVNDANGAGTRPLQQFGVYSSDLDPDVDVSIVYAEVTYSSCWTVYNSEFRGHGDGQADDANRTFTMRDTLDLSGQPAGTTIAEWKHDSSDNNLESDDILKFQFYNASGWSDYYTAFADDLSNEVYFYYVIPEPYLTSQFKMRFYLDGFNGSGEYCYVNDIGFAQITGTPDSDAVFTIDGYDIHAETVNALVSQLIGNKTEGEFSFACRADVTDLVRAHSDRNASNEPIGNAEYTVGGVDSTSGASNQLAYAGWSLVVIYHSSTTAGRQLYLWDYFSYSKGGENLDFDKDGSPGGTIKGFIVPDQIPGETEAAKLTAFVGEGDLVYSGDQLIFNGSALDDGYGTSNIWNSRSIGMSKDGVDIDTFSISWASGLLHTGDNQAQIDLPTQIDNFNLIYIIMSVRSKTIIGGTEHYVIQD